MTPTEILIALSNPDTQFERSRPISDRTYGRSPSEGEERYWDHASRDQVFGIAERKNSEACAHVRVRVVGEVTSKLEADIQQAITHILEHAKPEEQFLTKKLIRQVLSDIRETIKND